MHSHFVDGLDHISNLFDKSWLINNTSAYNFTISVLFGGEIEYSSPRFIDIILAVLQ